MACTFPIERETAVWPPPAPLRELLLDADPDERRIADHLAHGRTLRRKKLRDCRRSHCYPSDEGTYMGNHELLRSS